MDYSKGNWAKYPVEYSIIFYFLFSILFLFKKFMDQHPLVFGFSYLLTLIFNINNMIETQTAINNLPGFFI